MSHNKAFGKGNSKEANNNYEKNHNYNNNIYIIVQNNINKKGYSY